MFLILLQIDVQFQFEFLAINAVFLNLMEQDPRRGSQKPGGLG